MTRVSTIDVWNNQTLVAWLNRVHTRFGYITMLGLPDLKDRGDLPIDQLFVAPSLQRAPRVGSGPNIVEVLAGNDVVVVLGDPGSGKSTLVSWVTHALASRMDNSATNTLGRRIPLPFLLRDLRIDGDTDTFEKLLGRLRAQPWCTFADDPVVEEALEVGQAVVLIDGLDEVSSPSARRALRQAIGDGISRYPRVKWLLTSRILGWEQWRGEARAQPADGAPERSRLEGEAGAIRSWLPSKGSSSLQAKAVPLESLYVSATDIGRLADVFRSEEQSALSALPDASRSTWATDSTIGQSELMRAAWRRARRLLAVARSVDAVFGSQATVYYVQPFDDARIRAFAQNWYRLRVGDRGEAEQKARSLVDAVSETNALRDLAGTPNLLALMALVHRVHTRLPAGRAVLYDKIAEAYLESIDRAYGIQALNVPLEEKRLWISSIALEMQRRRVLATRQAGAAVDAEILLSRDDASSILRGLGAPAEEFLAWAAQRAGLLVPRTEETVAFTHLSFQEHLAARQLQNELVQNAFRTKQRDRVIGELREWMYLPACREALVQLFEGLRGFPGLGEDVLGRLVKGRQDRSPSELDALGALLDELRADEGTALQACRALDNALRDAARAVVGGEQRVPRWVRDMSILGDLKVVGPLTLEDATRLQRWAPIWDRHATRMVVLRIGEEWPAILRDVLAEPGLNVLHVEGAVPDLSGFSGLQLPSSVRLDLSAVTDLGAMRNHQEVVHLVLRTARGITDFRPLEHVRALEISGAEIVDLEPFRDLENLRSLQVQSPTLASTRGVGGLTALAELSLWSCPALIEIPEVASHPTLRWLSIEGCEQLMALGALSPLVERLTLGGLAPEASVAQLLSGRAPPELRLADLPGLVDLRLGDGLRSLSITGCQELRGLEMAGSAMLENLQLRSLPALTDASRLRLAVSTGVTIEATGLRALPPLPSRTRELELAGNPHLIDIGVRSGEVLVGQMHLSWGGWGPAASPPRVRATGIAQFDRWPSLPLDQHIAPSLWSLTVAYCSAITGWSALGANANLRYLQLTGSPFTEVPSLSGCVALASVMMGDVRGNLLLSPFIDHPALVELRIVNAPGLVDLKPLATVPTLRWLSLRNCPAVTDLTPLLALPPGGVVDVRGSGVEKVPRGLKWTVTGLGR